MRRTTTDAREIADREIAEGTGRRRVVLMARGHAYEGREGTLLAPDPERGVWRQIHIDGGYTAFARDGEYALLPSETKKQEAPE